MKQFVGTFLILITLALPMAAQPGSLQGVPGASPQQPDTLTALIAGPDRTPKPRWAVSRPDTIFFGQPLTLTLEFPAGSMVQADSIRSRTPWLHVAAQTPATVGDLIELELRCWRVGPWRLAWGEEETSEVMWTQGRLTGDDASFPVRDPWRPTRDLRILLLLGLISVLLAAGLGWWLAHRTPHGFAREASRPLDPAWMTFAKNLRTRVESGQPKPGATRAYLADLGRDLRGYLQQRYAVPSAGLVGGEVGPAVLARDYPSTRGDAFDHVLRECDRCRFDPREPSADVCRRLTQTAVEAVGRDRTGSRTIGVGALAATGADAEWASLLETCRRWGGGPSGSDEVGR